MKKELYLPLVLIALSAAFIAVSFLVWITRGNDSLLKKKLRIGALILSLTGVATGCWSSEEIYCYVPSVGSAIIVEDTRPHGTIELDMSVTNKLSGEIYPADGEELQYAITDQNDQDVQTGAVEALDGAFDEKLEEFELVVRSDIATGQYILKFYVPDPGVPDVTFFLHIIND